MQAASVSWRRLSARWLATARAYSREMLRGILAGIAGAATWAAAEPLLGRALGTPYSDARLLGGLVADGPHWRPAGVGVHLVNGGVFGAVFARLGGHGIVRGIAAAQVENLALWPGMAVVDRVHPDRRRGAWPPLLRNGRVFAYEMATHALFGAVLGALVREPHRRRERR